MVMSLEWILICYVTIRYVTLSCLLVLFHAGEAKPSVCLYVLTHPSAYPFQEVREFLKMCSMFYSLFYS